jgi:phenylalanyl-tRNA synthetase alpha chain
LHSLERKVLIALKDGATLSTRSLKQKTNLSEDSISRAVFWLSSKGYAQLDEVRRTRIQLGPEGKKFLEKGVPERVLVETVLREGGKLLLDDASKLSGLRKDRIIVAVGWARKKSWLQIVRKNGRTIVVVKEEPFEGPDERLIKLLSKGPVLVSELSSELLKALEALRERPEVITPMEEVDRSINLTEKGLLLARGVKEVENVSQLTPELIKSKRWRQVRLRRYDVEAPVAEVWPGKKQPYKRFLDNLKHKLVALGFKEMVGPLVEFMLFNCDALYMPQDHPAREIHDIYYLTTLQSSPGLGKTGLS